MATDGGGWTLVLAYAREPARDADLDASHWPLDPLSPGSPCGSVPPVGAGGSPSAGAARPAATPMRSTGRHMTCTCSLPRRCAV